jgi:hypothetical protein
MTTTPNCTRARDISLPCDLCVNPDAAGAMRVAVYVSWRSKPIGMVCPRCARIATKCVKGKHFAKVRWATAIEFGAGLYADELQANGTVDSD